MGKALRYMQPKHWALFGVSVVFIWLQVFLDLRIPDYMSNITRMVKTEGSPMSEIWKAGGMMLLCALGSMAVTILGGFISALLASSYSRELRGRVFRRVEAFSMEEIDGFSTASLITRSTNDIQQIQMFVTRGLQMLVRAPVMAIWAIYKMSSRQWEWSALTALGVVMVVGVVIFVIRYAQPRFRRMQSLTDDLNKVTRENLTGIRVIRAYNAEKYQQTKFDAANDRLTNNALAARRAMQVMRPVTSFVNNGLTIGIYCVGAFIIAKAAGAAQLGIFADMVVFSTYASKLLMSFMSLEMIFMMLPRATVSAGRINEVLDRQPSIVDGDREEGEEGQVGTVEFRDVSFRYPGTQDDVLRHISFKAEKGQTIAFIGATGSGKSSLVNLVPRLYDATTGTVLVDGVDVRDYRQTALHNKLGYAPQKAVLFTGTVESNVGYGDVPRTHEEVAEAVEIAQAKDFVENMDLKYDAAIARGGTNVSGGQKQRLSIARAVARRPEIYIFDDSFSALDYRTDRALRAALKEKTAGTTTLIVAQRIGTIRDADKIIVLEDGEIVGMGTHSELMENCSVYQEIAYTQLSEEDLK